MRLRELIAGLPLGPPPDADPEITGIRHDSRRVRPGDLYAALPGARFDGLDFVPQALERGAVAVLAAVERPAGVELPWLRCDQPRAVLGPLAARLYGHPDRRLVMAGVTGTNGKSTVVALVAALLEAAGLPAGRIGTLGYVFRDRRYLDELDEVRTTPEAPDLFALLAAMADDGARAVVMEVSSHGLDQGRVEGAGFDVAAFTNLSHDHLDYHGDLESYFAAKSRLFDQRKAGGKAVVNAGDPYGRRLASSLADTVTYSATEDAADVVAAEAALDLRGIRARVLTPRGPLALHSPLLGRYNLENLLAAVAVGEALELPHEAVAAGLAQRGTVRGRMEPVDAGQDFPILIDFAHTPAALEAALTTLRELVAGRRILLVFGCGGDRDRDKRRPMGELAGRLADRVFATSDNPRGEDPQAILAAVEEGLKASGARGYRIVADRRQAIRQAVALARSESRRWALLVAGKGHEEEQIVGRRRLPFSDRQEIAVAVAGGEVDGG